MVPFAKPSFLSCVTGFAAVLSTDLSPVETGCLPCDKPTGEDVVHSIGAAEPPKKTYLDLPSRFCVSSRWLWSRYAFHTDSKQYLVA